MRVFMPCQKVDVDLTATTTMKMHLETLIAFPEVIRYQNMEMLEMIHLKGVHMVGHAEVGGFRGGRRGGISNGETTEGEFPRRVFDRHSGTGRGACFKHEGAGRGNWGTPADEIATETEEPVVEGVKHVDAEKPSEQEDVDADKETPANEPEEKEPEEKEMTLEEYEKVLEEKRKPLAALKFEEMKVNLDKELETMQILSNKKNDDEFFVKLGSDKDKHKEAAEKAKKGLNNSGPVMTPAEALVAIHGIDLDRDGIPLKKVTDSCNVCFE